MGKNETLKYINNYNNDVREGKIYKISSIANRLNKKLKLLKSNYVLIRLMSEIKENHFNQRH